MSTSAVMFASEARVRIVGYYRCAPLQSPTVQTSGPWPGIQAEETEYLIIHPVTLPFCSELPNWTLEDICTDAHVGKFDWFMNYFCTVNFSKQRWKLIVLY